MRDVCEQHIKETIEFRTDLKKLPKTLIVCLVCGFDGSGENFMVLEFHVSIFT
jgi:hypothetical protein